jgi:alpha-glucosidase
MYRDGPDADYRVNPLPITIEKKIVRWTDVLPLDLAPGGGTAIRFRLIE